MFGSLKATRRHGAAFTVNLAQWRKWFEGDTSETETPPVTNGGTTDAPKTLPQDEVNRLVGDARKQAREKALADFLKELGVDTPDALKATIADAKKRAEADMTEAQKAQAAKEAAEKERDEIRAALEAERQARQAEKRNAAIERAAKDAEAPEDVVTWAEKHAAELLAKTLTEDGAVDSKAVEKVVEACKQARPSWFKKTPKTPGSPSVAGGRSVEPDKAEKERIARIGQRAIRG